MRTTVEDILEFAIAGEQAANKFYKDLAAQMDNDDMRQVFEEFAAQELSHKAKLERVKQEGMAVFDETKPVQDLKIADYVVDVEPGKQMSYWDAIIVAMKREKAAFRMYTELADLVTSAECRELFRALAQEEANHKLRFELEYDEHVMQEN